MKRPAARPGTSLFGKRKTLPVEKALTAEVLSSSYFCSEKAKERHNPEVLIMSFPAFLQMNKYMLKNRTELPKRQ